ncbi:hypothetical protein GCM10014715_63120 [Streptomyces spiralis]|uniref:Uncharacterized protein n=1 Tax=Streptomyces spiralis TaxID=66376 RepID=A0A919E0R5_9ACTN|nr:hypothetical protein GCM10014715_63120 [Streptomyces spiralis]
MTPGQIIYDLSMLSGPARPLPTAWRAWRDMACDVQAATTEYAEDEGRPRTEVEVGAKEKALVGARSGRGDRVGRLLRGQADLRATPFGCILAMAQPGAADRPPGGVVILFALLVPAVMMALLFGTTALEELLFPHPAGRDSTDENDGDAANP